jgi:hypothetical protein
MAANNKKKQVPIWNDESDHFVLYMDIMGFKDRVLREDHVELRTKLLDFKTKNAKLKPLALPMTQFSDSIIVSTYGTAESDLNKITRAAAILMQVGLETGFPLKGCIAMGPMTFDVGKQLFFGQPLVDAYLLEEELKFYGVAIHHTAEAIAIDIVNKLHKRTTPYIPIVKKEVALKSGRSEHYIVDWSKFQRDLSKGDIKTEVNLWLDKICHTVSGAPRIYIDNTRQMIN